MNIVVPIWKDYILTASGDYVDYTVSLDGEIIYRGRAYKRPGASQIEWSINSIAADYLRPVWPGFPADMEHSGENRIVSTGAKRFVVEYGNTSQELTFCNDWSYVAAYGSGNSADMQSVVIFPDYDRRIPLFQTWSTYNDISRPDAVDLQIVNRLVRTSIGIVTAEGSVVVRPVDTCYRHVLFFVNAFGGWSFIYLEALKAQEDYDRKTAKRIYSSADATARGAVDYVNEVTRRWTAKTPYLTDAQAAKMWHVLGTVAAYLYDMQGGQLTPVSVTDGRFEEKTYRNQGAKRVRYDISLTLAQDRLRRY